MTATRGQYRRAQSVLLRNPEGVASAETVEEQHQRVGALFEQYRDAYKRTLRQDELDWTVYRGLFAVLIEPTVLALLQHWPILRLTQANASGGDEVGTDEGMKRNADTIFSAKIASPHSGAINDKLGGDNGSISLNTSYPSA